MQHCLTHRLPDVHNCTANINNNKPSATDKHAKGKALIEKLRLEREAKEKAKAAENAKKTYTRKAETTTLQQIRASIRNAAEGAVNIASNAVNSVAQLANTDMADNNNSNHTDNNNNNNAQNNANLPTKSKIDKIRIASTGDNKINDSDRWYWQVDRDNNISKKPKTVYTWVNKQWTIGKSLDHIASLLNVENNNHVTNAKKLVITCPRSNCTFPNDVPIHLLEPALMNGDTVVLKYAE